MNCRPYVFAACISVAIALTGCVEEASRTLEDAAAAARASGNPVESGEISFALYCVSCHGEFGKGDGPVASALNTPPADLTRLVAKYDGVFPADQVYQFIDGRRDVLAHGTRDMPVWGNIWSEKDGHPIEPELVDERIRELVEYIRSIQAP
jgi:mono/diheme cytochrome c family protein